MELKKGDILEVVIEKVEGSGKAVARIGQFVVFVNKGIPGQTVKVEVIKRKNRYAHTVLLEVIEEAKNAIEPQCAWFGKCGGCVWQNCSYPDQLDIKKNIIADAVKHVGKVENLECILPVLESPKQWYYRNKIELSFGPDDEGVPSLGFRKKGVYDSILPIDVCHIFDERFPELIKVLRQWTLKTGKTHYDMKDDDGYFQYCMVRKTEYEDKWMINIITREGGLPEKELLLKLLKKTLGDSFSSLYHTMNHGGVGYAHHEDKKVFHLFGETHLTEKIGELKFLISPFSFFQTNTTAAEVLYKTVKEFAAVESGDVIVDLYCGTGTIGQYIGYGKDVEIHGIEIVPSAIQDAFANSEHNGIENVTYYCGDARRILKEHFSEVVDLGGVTVVDPPRAGLSKKALKRALNIGTKKFIYVSCNPATFSRDMKYIHEETSYQIKYIQPVDMFPHTSHIELVALFEQEGMEIRR